MRLARVFEKALRADGRTNTPSYIEMIMSYYHNIQNLRFHFDLFSAKRYVAVRKPESRPPSRLSSQFLGIPPRVLLQPFRVGTSEPYQPKLGRDVRSIALAGTRLPLVLCAQAWHRYGFQHVDAVARLSHFTVAFAKTIGFQLIV